MYLVKTREPTEQRKCSVHEYERKRMVRLIKGSLRVRGTYEFTAELVRNDVFSQDLKAGGAMPVYSAQVRAKPDGASDQRVAESVQDYI